MVERRTDVSLGRVALCRLFGRSSLPLGRWALVSIGYATKRKGPRGSRPRRAELRGRDRWAVPPPQRAEGGVRTVGSTHLSPGREASPVADGAARPAEWDDR